MNRTLMRAVVELAAFFALSSDDVINPDVAVSQLEALAAVLRELNDEERAELQRYLIEMAQDEESRGASVDRLDFLQNFTVNVGLTD